MSTPGGTSKIRSCGPTTSSSARRICAEPTKIAVAPGEAAPPPRLELAPPAHRVLELRAVRLDRVGRPDRSGDRRARKNVVGEDEIGREMHAGAPRRSVSI